MNQHRQAAARIITSRLLILQSKRLMLGSVQRMLRDCDDFEKRMERLARCEQLTSETQRAHEVYERTILRIGSTEKPDYWVVAYSRLIASGTSLVSKMRSFAASLPPESQFETGDEMEALEELTRRWTYSMRKSMTEAVA